MWVETMRFVLLVVKDSGHQEGRVPLSQKPVKKTLPSATRVVRAGCTDISSCMICKGSRKSKAIDRNVLFLRNEMRRRTKHDDQVEKQRNISRGDATALNEWRRNNFSSQSSWIQPSERGKSPAACSLAHTVAYRQQVCRAQALFVALPCSIAPVNLQSQALETFHSHILTFELPLSKQYVWMVSPRKRRCAKART